MRSVGGCRPVIRKFSTMWKPDWQRFSGPGFIADDGRYLQMVQGAMAQMGDPSEFGELPTGEKRDEASVDAESASCVSSRHLYRSRTNRSIAGVCGGIAEFFGIDSTILRLITLFLILFGGLSLWVYIILWIVIPSEPLNCISSKSKNLF